MNTKKPINQNIWQNYIWHKLFLRSANAFAFDLKDKEIDLEQFSVEDLYSLVAICDDLAVKSLIFKDELKRRIS